MSRLIIDPRYNINIYLDTNILVDYMCREYPLLNSSIDYLSGKDVVNLKSSHFILFEYAEVRKYHFFLECLKRDGFSECCQNEDGSQKKIGYVKQANWSIGGKDYSCYANEIQSKVMSELEFLRTELAIDFEENVLHEGLITPTNDLCLSTAISKEDCLVMISCVYPNTDIKLPQCLILSRDQNCYTAFNKDPNLTAAFFERHSLFSPTLLYTENLINSNGRMFNLYSSETGNEDLLKKFWDEVLREHFKIILQDNYIGETYISGKNGIASECIYFKVKNSSFNIRQTRGLFFLNQDLTARYSVPGPFEFWNNGHPIHDYPFANSNFPYYSFRAPQELPQDTVKALRQNGLLVFYDDM